MSAPTLRAPFPWFGGKSRAAGLVWAAFGDVANYVEPFAGSLAVLLARPTAPRIETVNDRDAYLANFWRAAQHAPAEVARWADWPVSEADLHARHLWLVQQADFRERMLTDPDFFDAKIAGWWVWGLSAWLGSGWCDVPDGTPIAPPQPEASERDRPGRQLPRLSSGGQGINRAEPSRAEQPSRQIPFVGNAGRGVHRGGGHVPPAGPSRQLPELYAAKGTHSAAFGGNFDALAARLRRVRVCCGDWSRVVTDSVTVHVGRETGILLDPPYTDGAMDYAVGGTGGDLARAVRDWAVEHGDDRRLRIALCGYEGEHEMPASWQCVPWKAKGGYGNTRKTGTNDNARRERIWFSPHCLPVHPPQRSLFEATP